MCKQFNHSRMCKEEAELWADSYIKRVLSDPSHFDSDYSILLSYPDEVIKAIASRYASVPISTEPNTK